MEDAEERGGESFRGHDKVTKETRRDTVHTWAQPCSSLPQDSNGGPNPVPVRVLPQGGETMPLSGPLDGWSIRIYS